MTVNIHEDSSFYLQLFGMFMDNDRAARVLFVQHPREQGELCSQNPSVARALT